MTIVVIAEAPQRRPARDAKDRLRRTRVVDDLDVDDASSNAGVSWHVQAMVGLHQAHVTVHSRVADASEVDELVPLDGFAATLVLPVAHLYDDVHHINLSPIAWCP